MKIFIYDQAKVHQQGYFPSDVDETQMYVIGGMYLQWLVDNRLVNEWFIHETPDSLFEALHHKENTPLALYEYWRGQLVSDMLTEEGNDFSLFYYPQYHQDFREVFSYAHTPYHVLFTWERYENMAHKITQTYSIWREQ